VSLERRIADRSMVDPRVGPDDPLVDRAGLSAQ
jgi:hypothetical protein